MIGNIDYKDAPFTQFVQSAYGLTDKVLTAVVYAIGFDGNDEGMWEWERIIGTRGRP